MQAMKALRAAHKEELDREVEKAKNLASGLARVDKSHRGLV